MKTRNGGRKQALFREVVLPYLTDALSLARWITGSPHDAEDVVQEACIRAFNALEDFAGGNARGWLLSIIRNTAFTWLAKNRPKMLIVTDDEQVFEEAHAAMPEQQNSTPEAALIAKADATFVHDAIAALPLSFRETLVLREVNGLSYREIANLTAVPVGTVMSRLARARQLLIARIGTEQSRRDTAT